MRKHHLLLALCLLAACTGQSPTPSQSATPAQSPTPAQTPVQVQPEDFITFGSGGGIDGRWESTTIRGDGTVEISGDPGEISTRQLKPEQVQEIFTRAVEAGLLELKNYPPSGADMLGAGIQARVGDREVGASKDEMVDDAKWDAVLKTLQLPAEGNIPATSATES